MGRIFQKFVFTAFIVSAVSISSCKKENSQGTTAKPQIENFDKIVRFLSVTLGVSEDRIKYDDKKEEFYVPNTVYHAPLDDILAIYNRADEYKLNYEK